MVETIVGNAGVPPAERATGAASPGKSLPATPSSTIQARHELQGQQQMHRPTSVTVFGILNIVTAGFGMFMAITSCALFLAPADSNNPSIRMLYENPAYAAWLKLCIPLGLLSCTVLLVAGIGLLCLKSWARTVSIAYAIYDICMHILSTAVSSIFLFQPFLKNHQDSEAAATAMFGLIGGGTAVCLGLIYPILLLVFMLRPTVAAAFHPPAPAHSQLPPQIMKTTAARTSVIVSVCLLLLVGIVTLIFYSSKETVRAKGLKPSGYTGVWRQEKADADSQSVAGNASTDPETRENPSQPSTFTQSAGQVELKLKWPPGKRDVMDFDFKQNTAILLQGRTNTLDEDFTMGFQFGRTVLRETPGGGHELELEFLGARMGIKAGDHMMLDYDSANPTAADQTNGVAAVFGKIVGAKLRYSLNAGNDPEHLEGVDELVRHIQSVPQASPLTGDIKNIFSAAFFDVFTNGDLFLPRHAVQPGDTWPSHLERTVAGVGIEVWDCQVIFQNWEVHDNRNCARLELQGIMKVKPDPNSKRDETVYHPRDGISQGVAWFDPELGQIIETDMKNDINVDKQPRNPSGTPSTAGPTQTITTQRHESYTLKLKDETASVP
jgi:hypothetical protein